MSQSSMQTKSLNEELCEKSKSSPLWYREIRLLNECGPINIGFFINNRILL